MKKLTQLEHLKTLKTNCTETFNNTEKNLLVLYYTNFGKVEIFHALHDKMSCTANEEMFLPWNKKSTTQRKNFLERTKNWTR